MKNLQHAADDVGDIAETIQSLGKMLDQFHATHGTELYERLETAWPLAREFGGSAPKPLFDLAGALTPPDGYDTAEADNRRQLFKFVMFG